MHIRSLVAMLPTTVTLIPLNYSYDALEPYISGQINELHYTKHHQAYVNNYNNFTAQYAKALENNDVESQVQLLPNIKFNAGGILNHNQWWEILAPQKEGGGQPPADSTQLASAIKKEYGSLDKLQDLVNAKLATIQGSGWAYIVKDKATGNLDIITTANQDFPPSSYVPIVGIDAWEHAYYLQYKTGKAEYFKAVWNVVNWATAAKRYDSK